MIFIITSLNFFFIFIQSCERSNLTTNKELEKDNPITTVDGILCFSSGKQFFNTIDNLSIMTEQQYSDWEANLGFLSNYTKQSIIFESLDDCATEEDLYNVLNSNLKFIKLSEENEILPIINYGMYSKVVNEDGYFYINTVLHKVTSNFIYISNSGKDAIETSISSGVIAEDVQKIKYFHESQTKGCGSTLSTGQKTVDRRRVKIYMRTEESYTYDSYIWTVRNYVTWEVKGFKKVLFAWYSYNTRLKYKDVEYTVNALCHNIYNDQPDLDIFTGSSPGPVTTPYEAQSELWAQQVGETMEGYHPDLCPDPLFKIVKGKGSSRGLDYDTYAEINCYIY